MTSPSHEVCWGDKLGISGFTGEPLLAPSPALGDFLRHVQGVLLVHPILARAVFQPRNSCSSAAVTLVSPTARPLRPEDGRERPYTLSWPREDTHRAMRSGQEREHLLDRHDQLKRQRERESVSQSVSQSVRGPRLQGALHLRLESAVETAKELVHLSSPGVVHETLSSLAAR